MRQLAAVALVAALALAGCAGLEPQPSPPATVAPSTTPTAPETTDAASPSATAPETPAPETPAPEAPAPASSDPGTAPAPGTGAPADPELDAFRAALEGRSPTDPDDLVAAVVAAGFERSAIERTAERDSLGRPVTFLEIAVRMGETCLVGQVGDGEPLALRAAALGGGRCLVGDVIALD